MAAPFRVVAADEAGKTWDIRGWHPAVRSGIDIRPAQDEDWIPAPSGTRLQFLQGRKPVGWPKGSHQSEAPVLLEGCWAVAAQLPSGYTRTLLPAYKLEESVAHLPFFGYTAVAFRQGEPWVAALKSDASEHWQPVDYNPPDLKAQIESYQQLYPQNRVLDQLKHCSLDYGCYNAQNIFLGRWEGAVPVSPACNAECVGCISQQPKHRPSSPQQRFAFVPSEQEIVEIGLAHLQNEDSIYSFGQGCEGEPLLQARLIARAVKSLRALTATGTIHLNTNASKPEGFKLIAEAGLDSVRVSLNSVIKTSYTAYYQPRGYSFEDVKETIRIARNNGVRVSLNYLHMPGWNDREQELEQLIDFVQGLDIQMIQLRTLNIDPDLYAGAVPMPGGQALGIPKMLASLRSHCPHLLLGNHTLPKYRYASRALNQG